MHFYLFIATKNELLRFTKKVQNWDITFIFLVLGNYLRALEMYRNLFSVKIINLRFFTSIEIVEDGQVCLRYTSQA